MADITSNDLGKWRDSRLKTVSGSTVVLEVNLYRNLFKIAATEWKEIQENPFQGVRLPKENASRVAVWRWQYIKRVLRSGQARGGKTLEATLAFHIALRTAFRLQEALAALGGFDKARRVVSIPPSEENLLPQTVPLTRQGWRLMQKMPILKVGSNSALAAKVKQQHMEMASARRTGKLFCAR